MPSSDELKHFGAAMASFGSVALFHMAGVTPEAQRCATSAAPPAARTASATRRRSGAAGVVAPRRRVDVVVFSAPQLSLLELRELAACATGGAFTKPLLAVTSPQVKPDADRFGFTERIEAAGGHVLSGCASTSPMRARSPKPTAGRGSPPTPPSWSTSSAATATCRCCFDGALRRGRVTGRSRGMSVRRAPRRRSATRCAAALVATMASRRATTSTASAACSRGPTHKLAGQSYVGRILVLDTAKGGVASAWMLHEMAARGVVPLALVLNRVNPILVQGAAFGDVTMLVGLRRRHHREGAARRTCGGGPRGRLSVSAHPRAAKSARSRMNSLQRASTALAGSGGQRRQCRHAASAHPCSGRPCGVSGG